jgi:transglutaminase-like putative cysteine protease
MKVEIRYAADYCYETPVTFSPHLFRLIPKVDRSVKLRRFEFRTHRAGVVHWRRDLFDNEVASVFYPKPARVLRVRLKLSLDIEEKNAFGFLLAPDAMHLPFAYSSCERSVLHAYFSGRPAPRLAFWQPPSEPAPTVDTLVSLNSALHAHIAYERRDEGEARSSEETLALGRGACRDFSVLMVEVLRGLGLAARFASGYLCEFGTEQKRAEGALHAWVEAYLPGAGWVGFDPTNGTLCDHHHLAAAAGVATADVAPVVGSYYHVVPVPHTLNTSLEILPDGRR